MKGYPKFSLTMMIILGVVVTTFTWPYPVLAAGVVGTGTSASCTEAALTTALTGGGSVTFNCGPNPAAITMNSRKIINAATTVDGGDLITLNGSNGVFLVSANQALTLQNLTLGNSTVSDGAVDNRGQLTLQNVTIKDNKRGLVNNFGGVAMIQNSTFQNNSPSSAIFNQNGTMTINNSSFSGNNAFLGGAIDNESNSYLTVTNSVFNGNTSGNGGGSAIYNGGVANIIKSTFTDNSSASAGGAIYTSNVMTITQSTITSNTAVSGGGIQSREHLQVIDSRISNNTSTVIGGSGIYHNHLSASSNSLTLVNTTLDGNGGGGSRGGTIYFNSPQGILNLTNVTLSDNSIQNGGGWTVPGFRNGHSAAHDAIQQCSHRQYRRQSTEWRIGHDYAQKQLANFRHL